MVSRHGKWWIPGRRGMLMWALLLTAAALVGSASDLLHSYRLVAARQALYQRDFNAAVRVLEKASARGEGSAEWHCLMARAHRRQGHADIAQQHLEQAAQCGYPASDIANQRLLLQAQAGDIKQIEAQLVELLQSGLSDEAAEETYEVMARGYLAGWHVPDAARCLKFWIEFQPDNPLPRIWQGDLYRRMENPGEAIANYREAIKLAPQNTQARLSLAQVLLERLDVEEAATHFQHCLDRGGDPAAALLGLAECCRRQGLTETAGSLLHDALAYDLTVDQGSAALASLGQIALENGQQARAIQTLQQAILLDANTPGTRLALAAALQSVGESEAAEAERKEARQIVERHNRLVAVRRKVLVDPDNADLRCDAGLILMEQGLLSAGAGWVKTALVIDPTHRASHAALADYYRLCGDLMQANRHETLAARAAGEDGSPDGP